MSKGSDAVKRWRQNAKRRLIRAFGGKCCVCGYDKCEEVMEFHHLDPSTKETSWSQIRGHIKGWSTIVDEMRKCVMVCSNCHKEVHASYSIIPDNAPRFDERLSDYKQNERAELHNACPVCGRPKLKAYKTCSLSCAASRKFKVNWNAIDVVQLVDDHPSYEAVGDLLGISGAAVARQYKIAINRNKVVDSISVS